MKNLKLYRNFLEDGTPVAILHKLPKKWNNSLDLQFKIWENSPTLNVSFSEFINASLPKPLAFPVTTTTDVNFGEHSEYFEFADICISEKDKKAIKKAQNIVKKSKGLIFSAKIFSDSFLEIYNLVDDGIGNYLQEKCELTIGGNMLRIYDDSVYLVGTEKHSDEEYEINVTNML